MAKMVSAVFSLRDEFTKKMQEMSGKSNKEFKKMEKDFSNLKKSVANTFKKVGKAATVGIGAMTVATAGFLKSSVTAFNNYNEQVTKLKAVMKNIKGATEEQSEALVKYAHDLQDVGIIGEDVILAGTQQLATYNLQADSLKKLMPAISNVVAQQKGFSATSNDAMTVATMFGKVMKGSTTQLTKMGIKLSDAEQNIFKYGSETEKAILLARIFEERAGSVNEELRKTPQGTMLAFSNALTDIKQTIGSKLQPIVSKFMNSLLTILPKLKDNMTRIVDKIDLLEPTLSKLADTVANGVLNAFDKLLNIIDYISNNWSWLKWAIGGFTALVVAIKTVIAITNTYKALQFALLGVQILLKATNPFGWVELAMIGVFALTTYLFTKFGGLKALLESVGNVFKTVFNFFVTAYTSVTNSLYNAVGKYFSVIKDIFGKVFNFYFKAYSKIGSAVFKGLIGYFKVIKTVLEFVWNILQKIINGISNLNPFKWIGKGIDKVKGLMGVGSSDTVSDIPQNAMGTRYFGGGLTTINERGGELVTLPSGSTIIPHDLSKQAVNKGNNYNINLTINVDGNVTTESRLTDIIVDNLVKKLKLAERNI